MARPSESIPPLARESGVLDEFAHTSLDVDDGDEVEEGGDSKNEFKERTKKVWCPLAASPLSSSSSTCSH